MYMAAYGPLLSLTNAATVGIAILSAIAQLWKHLSQVVR